MLEPQDAALACPVLTGSLVQENQIPYALSGIEGIMWISERNRARGPMMYDDHEGRGRITPTVRKNATSWAHVHQKRRVAPFEHRGSTRRHRHDPPKRMSHTLYNYEKNERMCIDGATTASVQAGKTWEPFPLNTASTIPVSLVPMVSHGCANSQVVDTH